MESGGYVSFQEPSSPEPLPRLLRELKTKEVVGFDSSLNDNSILKDHYKPSLLNPANSLAPNQNESPSSKADNESDSKFTDHHRKHSVSISMPNSPAKHYTGNGKKVFFSIECGEDNVDITPSSTPGLMEIKFHSQEMPKGILLPKTRQVKQLSNLQSMRRLKKDNRYNSFKTWSGKLERQISNLRGRPQQPEEDEVVKSNEGANEALPADRYFDALEGPELETLRPSEEIVLPGDITWPFLLRFPISSFGICLGVGSQAILWKTLATATSTKFLHTSLLVNLVLWLIAVTLLLTISTIYLLKVVFFFEAVRREYYHPIRVNFFFAPWISILFLALGVPPSIATRLPSFLWYIFMFPILCLELKIYGQWMSGGQRRLSKVANPSNHLSVVGNFVGALLGASMGLKEGPIFFFAIGLAHYTVLFVTLYQRLPTNQTLPKELHPVFFLFVAAPSVASMAWAKINDSFDYGSRIALFIALFLYFSLVVRINFFRGFKFSLAWWAYTFPMTGAAIATIKYSSEVTTVGTQALSVFLSTASILTVTGLLASTVVHAFVLHDLFPNDIAIAISERKPKPIGWFTNLGSTDNIENYLKFACSESQDTQEPSSESQV